MVCFIFKEEGVNIHWAWFNGEVKHDKRKKVVHVKEDDSLVLCDEKSLTSGEESLAPCTSSSRNTRLLRTNITDSLPLASLLKRKPI